MQIAHLPTVDLILLIYILEFRLLEQVLNVGVKWPFHEEKLKKIMFVILLRRLVN